MHMVIATADNKIAGESTLSNVPNKGSDVSDVDCEVVTEKQSNCR